MYRITPIDHMSTLLSYLPELLRITICSDSPQRGNKVKFACSMSYLEIYNERIFDLLDAASSGLQLREDNHRGVYVQDLTHHDVHTTAEALEVGR